MEIVETIELKEPVTVELKDGEGKVREEKVAALEIRKPKVKHLKATDRAEGQVGKIVELIAVLTGHPAKVIDELAPEDFTRVSAVVVRFFPKHLGIGGESSDT